MHLKSFFFFFTFLECCVLITGALTIQWENELLKVIRQHQVSEIHLRRHARQTEVVVHAQIDSGDGILLLLIAAEAFNRSGSHQVNQSVHLVIPVLLLLPRFRRIGRLAVLHRIHALDLDGRVDAKDLEILERSEQHQAKSNTPSDQHQNAN